MSDGKGLIKVIEYNFIWNSGDKEEKEEEVWIMNCFLTSFQHHKIYCVSEKFKLMKRKTLYYHKYLFIYFYHNKILIYSYDQILIK